MNIIGKYINIEHDIKVKKYINVIIDTIGKTNAAYGLKKKKLYYIREVNRVKKTNKYCITYER